MGTILIIILVVLLLGGGAATMVTVGTEVPDWEAPSPW
jgi:hypothetical protein